MNFLHRIILKIAPNRFVVQDRIIFIYFLLISLELNFQWFGCFEDFQIWVKLLLPMLLGASYFGRFNHSKHRSLLLRVTFWLYALIVFVQILPSEYQLMEGTFEINVPYIIKSFLLCTSLGLLFLCIRLLSHKK